MIRARSPCVASALIHASRVIWLEKSSPAGSLRLTQALVPLRGTAVFAATKPGPAGPEALFVVITRLAVAKAPTVPLLAPGTNAGSLSGKYVAGRVARSGIVGTVCSAAAVNTSAS